MRTFGRLCCMTWLGCSLTVGAHVLAAQVQVSPIPQPTAPHHAANFEAERQQADALFVAGKPLEALPLYEDLSKQDGTVAVFAERHAAGLIAKVATVTDSKQRGDVQLEALVELRRAQSLGDNSDYVRFALNGLNRTLAGAIITNVPLSVGYTYNGNAAAQAPEQAGDAAFARSDWVNAAKMYTQAAAADPAWYTAALFTGDSYFRMNDAANAGGWLAKAIAIDPNRETAYRYWGDALYHAGDHDGARRKFVEAFVVEPYGLTAFAELRNWAQHTGHQMVKPAITRPDFRAPNHVLTEDPALAASNADGRSSWLVYQRYRVDHGAMMLDQQVVAGSYDAFANLTPNGYRHSIAEEHAALRAMLADVEGKIVAGTLKEADLDASIRNIRSLEHANKLGAWIPLCAADAGIRSDYGHYRNEHRKHLVEFTETELIR